MNLKKKKPKSNAQRIFLIYQFTEFERAKKILKQIPCHTCFLTSFMSYRSV